MRSRIRMAIAAVLVIVLVGGGVTAYLLLRSNSSTPVAPARAVARFRLLQGTAAPVGVPAPGVYTYSLSGWECGGIGGFCPHRGLPHRAELIVTRHGPLLTIETDLSAQHLEAQRYRLTAAGRLLVWQRTRITILGVTEDDQHAVVPPTTLALPARLTAGRRWVQRFSDAAVTVVSRNLVERRATVNVGGTPVSTWLIRSVSTTGGPHPGTERDLDWHSQALGLDVRFTIARDITGAFPYHLRAAARLISLTPAR
jgi:hypothetical protein